MIFSDSSHTNTDIGAAFCATERNEVTHRRACRLHDNNSIFEVKLFAIFKSLEWISQQKHNFF